MIEGAIVAVRLLQYAGVAILFGSSLFFVFVTTAPLTPALIARTNSLLAAGAAILTLSSALVIGLQASLFSGSIAAGFSPDAIWSVVALMDLGKAAVARAAVAAVALLLILFGGGRGWPLAGALGGIAAASLAWLGHGAATGNIAHLVADALHALAASFWIGSLFGFGMLLANARDASEVTLLQGTLRRFSAFGVPLVLVLAFSGLVNSWFLLGGADLAELPSSPYARLLMLKLAGFAFMLTLAAINRYRLTPALGAPASGRTAVAKLRLSILLEAAAGVGVIAAVAWLGTLEPPNAVNF